MVTLLPEGLIVFAGVFLCLGLSVGIALGSALARLAQSPRL